MGFVTNEVMHGKKLSEAVREALVKGFCEQDPREDFTGRDMAAKIVVLARALGVTLDENTIEVRGGEMHSHSLGGGNDDANSPFSFLAYAGRAPYSAFCSGRHQLVERSDYRRYR